MLGLKLVVLIGAACTTAALALAGVQTWRLDNAQDELAELNTRMLSTALTHAENARNLEDAWRKRVTHAQRTRETELAASRLADDALRADAGWVRDDIAAYAAGGPEDSIAACRGRAATLGRLLDRALQADRRSTERAETHAADARSLRDGAPLSAASEPAK